MYILITQFLVIREHFIDQFILIKVLLIYYWKSGPWVYFVSACETASIGSQI